MTLRGYELQYRTRGKETHWTSVFGSAERGYQDEEFIRTHYIRNAAMDYDADLDDRGDIEWRVVRVLEEVVEPPRTSREVVEWFTASEHCGGVTR